jgi:DNA invertase Pin-like site-specific DNA recombinase
MKVGYVRVSTEDQSTDMQRAALERSGVDRIYEDVISGKTTSRDGLDACLDELNDGDTIVVWKLDRLGRNVLHLCELITGFKKRGITFVSLTEGFDLSTPIGIAMFQLMAVFAELERNNTSLRTKAALKNKRDNGVILGRPKGNQEWKSLGISKSAYYANRKRLASEIN